MDSGIMKVYPENDTSPTNYFMPGSRFLNIIKLVVTFPCC